MNKRNFERVTKKLETLMSNVGEIDPFRSDYSGSVKVRKGCYPYVAACGDYGGYRRILEAIQSAKDQFKKVHKRKATTFMDLGSGLGGILIAAELSGLEATGVEYVQTYVDKSLSYRDDNKFSYNVLQGDILKFVPDVLPDIVYFWNPMTENILMRRFQTHLTNWVDKNQIIIDWLGRFYHDFEHLDRANYVFKVLK